MPRPMTFNLTAKGEADLTAVAEQREVDKTRAIHLALADFAKRLTADTSSGEAEYLAQILSDARLSSLQAAFRKLGWPVRFVLADLTEGDET